MEYKIRTICNLGVLRIEWRARESHFDCIRESRCRRRRRRRGYKEKKRRVARGEAWTTVSWSENQSQAGIRARERRERDRTLRMPEMASRLTRPGSLQHLSASSRLSPGEQLYLSALAYPTTTRTSTGAGTQKALAYLRPHAFALVRRETDSENTTMQQPR